VIAVIQRVSAAKVTIEGSVAGEIQQGLMVLLGITHTDNAEDVTWLAKKITNLRIFSDEDDKMNLSLLDVNGDILLVSQFTLHAATKKGNRPGYNEAAKPDIAIPLYEAMISELGKNTGKTIQTGEFGAMMDVSLTNDGPVTIIIDTKNKK